MEHYDGKNLSPSKFEAARIVPTMRRRRRPSRWSPAVNTMRRRRRPSRWSPAESPSRVDDLGHQQNKKRRSSPEEQSISTTPEDISSKRAWDSLPAQLLEMILLPLYLPDCIRFGAVCRWWNHVARNRPQLPLLMIPRDRRRRDAETWSFCSLSDNKAYTITLSGTATRYCCASSYGWLLFADPNSGDRFLLNPFSGSRIDLPPWKFIPRERTVSHAVLSLPPTNPNCVVIFVVQTYVMFCRIGGDQWYVLPFWDQPYTDRYSYITAIGGSVYFIYRWKLGVVDVFGDDHPVLTWLDMDCTQLEQYFRCSDEASMYRFLVESAGELLLVVMSLQPPIDVFRADMNKMAWERVRSLGDRSLFLGRGCCFSLAAAQGVAKGGRIYISHPVLTPNCLWKEYGLDTEISEDETYVPLNHFADLCFGASHWIFSNRM